MNRISMIVGVGSVAAAAALSLTVASFGARVIENRSTEAVEIALSLQGMDWVDVSADGLRVFLDGTAPDEAGSFLAATHAGEVVSADRMINRMQIARADVIAPPRFSLDMLRNGDGIQLIGLIPLETGGEVVADAIEDIAEGVEVTNMVETADFPTPESWAAALEYGLRALTELPRSKVTVYEDRVEVQAVSESVAERADFIAILERGQPRGVQVVLDISAPRPVITPFSLRFVMDADGAQFETCSADTIEARDRIVNAARSAGADGLVTCRIGLGVPSTQWADAAVLAVAAVAELGGGTVSFSDADVSLIGVVGTGQDEFDRVVGELDAALPDVFSLQASLPQPETNVATGPARFLTTLNAEGEARLRGRLPDGPIGQSVEAFAVALFGQDRTDLATRGVDDLPEGWAVRVMIGLQALSQLHEGELIVEPEGLTLRGRSGDMEARSDLVRLLAAELGPGEDFQIDIAYDEALDPVASLPTPEECVARIQAIQDEGKIVFEPGSISLTDSAGEILDRIAEVLPDCRHVRMEISGHTDSQGREEMNLNLSQSRADAVLNGLLARNVLVSNLTAQGYGESQPIADNEEEQGRERNRRIEFRLLTTAVTGEGALSEDGTVPGDDDTRPVQRPDSVAEAAAQAQE